MKLTERQKMMAASAHANNELRCWINCTCFNDPEQSRACLRCITDNPEFAVVFEDYNPGWPIGKLVRWLDSL